MLRITVTDNAGNTNSDEMTLVWDTYAPSVNAGADKTARTTVTQTGVVSDNQTSIATYAWAKVSGPGALTFGTSNAVETTISADTDGTYVVRLTSADVAGNSNSDTMNLVWDTAAPTTSDNAPSGWQAADVAITLSPADALSGVAGTKYCVDTANTCDVSAGTAYTVAVTVSAEGTNYFRYASVDNAGNTQTTVSKTIRIDKTAPTTTKNFSGAWHTTDVIVALNGTDTNSGVFFTTYSLNDGSFYNDTVFTVSSEANNSIRFYSVDNAGNQEAMITDYIAIDKTAPVTAINTSEETWYGGTQAVAANATEAPSGTAFTTCWVNDGAPTNNTIFLVAAEQNNTIRCSSTDIAGNIEANKTFYLAIDKTAPTTSDNAPSGWQAADVTVTLSPADALSGVAGTKYCVDTANTCDVSAGTAYTVAVTVSAEGTNYFRYASTDNAGNAQAVVSKAVRIDKTAPSIGSMSPADGSKQLANSVSFGFAPADALSTSLNCSLYVGGVLKQTNSSALNNTATALVQALATGAYDWSAKCTDAAGNSYQSGNRTLTVDTSADDLSFSSIQSANSAQSSVVFDLNLITVGSSGLSAISWSSNSTAVRATDGKVTRPAYGSDGAAVNLTATVSRSGFASRSVTFILTVPAEASSPASEVDAAYAALDFDTIKRDNTAYDNITGDLYLPAAGTNGTSISWSTGNAAIVTTTGKVSRTTADRDATLSANITKGSSFRAKEFVLVVRGVTDPDAVSVESSKAALTDALVLNGNPSLGYVIGDLQFPTSNEANGVAIGWSTTGSAIDSAGAVTRSASTDIAVNATATLTKGGASATRLFQFTVVKLPAPATADNGKVSVSNGTREVLIDSSNAAGITSIVIGSDVAADQPVSVNIANLTAGGSTATLSGDLNLTRDTGTANFTAQIESGTVITGPSDWNGVLNVPTVKASSVVTVPSTSTQTSTVDMVVEVGFTGGQLNFSKAVKLVLPGMAGRSVVYTRDDGSLVYSNACTAGQVADPDTLSAGADCYNDSGSDLVIWTKHFTQFAAYTATAVTATTGTPFYASGGVMPVTPTPTPEAPAAPVPAPAGCAYNNPACAEGYACDAAANRCVLIPGPTATPAAPAVAPAAPAAAAPSVAPQPAGTAPQPLTGLFTGSLFDSKGNLSASAMAGIIIVLLAAVGFVWLKAEGKK